MYTRRPITMYTRRPITMYTRRPTAICTRRPTAWVSGTPTTWGSGTLFTWYSGSLSTWYGEALSVPPTVRFRGKPPSPVRFLLPSRTPYYIGRTAPPFRPLFCLHFLTYKLILMFYNMLCVLFAPFFLKSPKKVVVMFGGNG